MKIWREAYAELEILCPKRNKRVASDKTIRAFERQWRVRLPKSYSEFSVLFGAGELSGYYRFCVPLDRKDGYDLTTINEEMHRATWGSYAPEGTMKRMIFFASTIGGEQFAWRTDEPTDDDALEYAIYRFYRHPQFEKVSSSFTEFFDKCRTGVLDPSDEPPSQTYLKY